MVRKSGAQQGLYNGGNRPEAAAPAEEVNEYEDEHEHELEDDDESYYVSEDEASEKDAEYMADLQKDDPNHPGK